MLRLTGIPFRTAPGAEYRTAAPRIGERGRNPWSWPFWGVYKVHTLAFGLGRTAAGSGRIPYVSAGVQCLQGLECSSSPTSGTAFPLVRGGFCFNVCTLPLLGSL